MQITLQGKRALVTGAASGIGKAISRFFVEAGAEVTLLDLHQSSAETAAAELSTGSVRCHALGCDVSDEPSVEAAFAQLGGRLDILVNSAGVAHVGSVFDTSASDFDRLYAVNVRGTFLCMKAALERMRPARSGVILNLASIAAAAGLPQRFAYSMTKGAVLAMTLSVARDCLADGIRCNCISPARVHTPFVDGFVAKNYPGQEESAMRRLAAAQPIGRMGTPEEVAQMALYLCSDSAAFVTGSDMPLDGGYRTLR